MFQRGKPTLMLWSLLQGYESEASRVNALVDDISALLGGNHNGVSYVRRPSSGPPLTASPALAPSHLHFNNNYT